MIKENNDLIICAQHCDTYDIVANCNIMLTNKVKNKNINGLYSPWLVYCDTLYYCRSFMIPMKWTFIDKLGYIKLVIYRSIYSDPLDFEVFEFYCILDFNSKGSYQIASIFDI